MEAAMGRPRELTDAERAELVAKGYRPVEMWIPDLSRDEVRERLRRELKAIREADIRTGELARLAETVEDLAGDFD
ncbi:MAG: antitoxin MazE-like protein [Mesorhizobium sp.]